ncbi:hypothetical protein M9Y10_027775 [Tritrichomonas musculus]|uniref:Adenylate and Guanylate cyclase catalytic domain containing protein n=1 Tax=Tritrichomonas musculus TaxID=1915356 RepID=A0ABR2H3Y5_9EUKA
MYVWLSFISQFSNVLVLAVLLPIIVMDIFRIYAELCPSSVRQDIYVICSFSMFFVFAIVSYIINKIMRKKILSKLTYSKLNESPTFSDREKPFEPSLEDKFLYFVELGLDKNMKKAMTYLVVGFTSASDLFVDFSLIQFCIDNYSHDTTMLVLLIRLLTYFKSEKKRLNSVLKQFLTLHDETFFNNFIFFQANRVQTIRQVTSANLSSIKLNELARQSINLEIQMKNFWALEKANINYLERLAQQQRYFSNLWNELIEENWSSVLFREEHIHFLIESCTDFQKAVQMTSIKDKLDVLMKYHEDNCFLYFIMCFPEYVKNRIVDFNGFSSGDKKKGAIDMTNSSSSGNNKQNSNESEEFSFDEQVANTILTHGRLRLAMQNALKYVNPSMSKHLIFYSIFSILGSLILIVTTFSLLANSFDYFTDWDKEADVLIELRIAYAKSFLSLSILYGKTTNRLSFIPIDCNATNDHDIYFLHDSVEFDYLALLFVDQVKMYFTNLLDVILQSSLKNNDISNLTNLLFNPLISSNICYNGQVINQENWSIEQTLNFEVFSFAYLATDKNIENWFINNSYWCHDITTFYTVETKFTEIQEELIHELSNHTKKVEKATTLAMIITGPLTFVIFVIPLPIMLYLLTREVNHLIQMMLLTDHESKEQARQNISLQFMNETNEWAPPLKTISFNWKYFIYCFLIFASFLFFIVFLELSLYNYQKYSVRLYNYCMWSCDFQLLRSFLIVILIELFNSIYFSANPQSYLSIPQFKRRIHSLLNNFESVSFDVLSYTKETLSLIGQDSIIDSFITQASCENPDFLHTIHDTYYCGSFIRLIPAIHSLVKKVAENIEGQNGAVHGEEITNIYHMIFAHAITIVLNVDDRLTYLQKTEIDSFNQKLLIFFIILIFCILIWTFSMIFIINDFKKTYSMALCLIRRLPPSGLINNRDLVNYLFFKKGEEIEMGVTHKIFNSSFDGIICMNLDGIVEIINKSFSTDYGYSTEQLVGQLIGIIFDNESRIKLENQLKLMKNNESSSYYTEHVTCFTNDGRPIPSFITLFAIKGNENSVILVVSDETILLQKKKRLELAKKQSQDLLEQIMPPKVLMMLKEGKSEISFAIPSASVMFVNLVNFSGLVADLSPQQTMGILSTLFGAFDTWIQKYPLMTKIKLIGDSYMAACGLFETDDEPKNHAKQCVEFALRVLNILDDANIKLNVTLRIRIGINSDGPIIAGVLGTENRVFDIIGDTINVASRLEHKAEPGHIMMSEKTYNLVKDAGFNIIPKGEVFLKGKGDVQAYSI